MSMMALLLLAQSAASAPAAPPPEPAVANEIAAIDARLGDWKGGVYKRDGKLTCRITESTGDAGIDAIRCGAMLRCLSPKADEMDAIAASDLPDADRKRKLQSVVAGAQPCIEKMHRVGARMLAEKRVDG